MCEARGSFGFTMFLYNPVGGMWAPFSCVQKKGFFAKKGRRQPCVAYGSFGTGVDSLRIRQAT